jgi:type 1 glutamine amidotransferase
MLKILLPTTLLLVVFGIAIAADDKPAKAPAPLKVLLVAGGCCHDYPGQSEVLKAGIESIINAEVTVDFNPDTSTEATFARYESADWADEFDVIIHDECSANVTDPDYVNRILDAHRGGVPAVNLHCGMHSYRWGEFREPVESGADNAGWYEMIGIQSSSHGPKAPIDVTFTDKKHPITVGMKDWTTIDEELYNNVQVFESGKGLASGSQMQMPKKKKGEKADPNAKPAEATAIVAWTNEYGPKKTKIFSTTLGHFTETVADDRYLDLVTRGILWTTGKIEDDGTPAEGYGN